MEERQFTERYLHPPPDFSANQCKQMYYAVTSGGSATWLRLSEMNLGGSGTSGLKWMAIDACFSLYHVNWANMQSSGIVPYNNNLHLILGTDTTSFEDANLMAFWARYMLTGKTTMVDGQIISSGPMTVENAWNTGAHDAYALRGQNYGSIMKFAAAGYSICRTDTLQTNSTPGGSVFYNSVQVYP